MENILKIFNFIVKCFLILGGISAYVIYFKQKHTSIKSAFTMLVNQIDTIEAAVSELLSIQAEGNLCNVAVFKSEQILRINCWSEYKHLVMQKLDQTDIKIIDDFFYNAERIELARHSIIKAMETGWQSKALVEQYMLATYLSSEVESALRKSSVDHPNTIEIDGTIDQKCLTFVRLFESRDELFTPKTPITILTKHLSLYRPIQTSDTYKKIKRYSL